MSQLEDAAVNYIRKKTELIPTTTIESSRAEYDNQHNWYKLCYDGTSVFIKQGILGRNTNYFPEVTRPYVRLDDMSDILLLRKDKFRTRLDDIVLQIESQFIASGSVQAKEYSINKLAEFLERER
jgi:hypothetical protein